MACVSAFHPSLIYSLLFLIYYSQLKVVQKYASNIKFNWFCAVVPSDGFLTLLPSYSEKFNFFVYYIDVIFFFACSQLHITKTKSHKEEEKMNDKWTLTGERSLVLQVAENECNVSLCSSAPVI